MKKLIFTSMMFALPFASSAQVPNYPNVECISEHHFESRAIYAIESEGCLLDSTIYNSRGDSWTAYGHLPALIGGQFKK